MLRTRSLCALALGSLLCAGLLAGEKDGRLDIYWTDVEGGAATLLVTPAGESLLVDAGMPAARTRSRSDPDRIYKTLTEVAGLKRLDHMVVSHFDIDHFGGVADLAGKIEIGRVWHPGIPDEHMRRMPELREAFEKATEGKRTVLAPGDVIPLRAATAAGPKLALTCIASKQRFLEPGDAHPENAERCAEFTPKDKDRSENANSIVLVLEFGAFRFLDAADLTWNLENQLVCPRNLVGQIDVFQADHHGLDQSNNPVLIRSVEPKVAIINNGPRKGCEPGMFKTLKSTPSIEAIYQLHRNVRVGDDGNAPAEFVANHEEDCDAEIVKLSVAKDGKSYTVEVPSTGHKKTYPTWK